MQCNKCSKDIPMIAAFCPYCGMKQESSSMNSTLEKGSHFCLSCGVKIDDDKPIVTYYSRENELTIIPYTSARRFSCSFDEDLDCYGIIGYEGNDKFIDIPPEIDGKKIEAICGFAFDECSALCITAPYGVRIIGSSAFEDCSSLVRIVLPNSVTHIGEDAFDFSGDLKEVIFKGNRYYKDNIQSLYGLMQPIKETASLTSMALTSTSMALTSFFKKQ